jgi:hypothetical protein
MTPPVALLKSIFVGNAYLVRQQIRVYDAVLDQWVSWTSGPATVTLCTASVGVGGVVTYAAIAGLGPFSLVLGLSGTWFYEIPTSAVSLLNGAPYLGATIYQVVKAGALNELQNVQPLLVSPSRYPL